jgi:hypothetical protein
MLRTREENTLFGHAVTGHRVFFGGYGFAISDGEKRINGSCATSQGGEIPGQPAAQSLVRS